MSWVPNTARTVKTALGLIAGGSVGIYVYNKREKESPHATHETTPHFESTFSSSLPLGKVIASWTTNFSPSTKWDKNWDRRDPETLVKPTSKTDTEAHKEDKEKYNESLKKVTPTATRHLFLIRHGQYVMANDDDKDRYLTELGKEQADFTGQRIKELGHPYTKLINSTMTRARETGDIIAKYIPDVPRQSCDLLREGAPIPPEPPVGHWRPEVQEFYEDGARIEAAFRKYFHRADVKQTENSFEVYACHANVIRYFVCRALQLPPEAWLRMSLAHASITWVVIRPTGRVHVRTIGDAGHIPANKVTFS